MKLSGFIFLLLFIRFEVYCTTDDILGFWYDDETKPTSQTRCLPYSQFNIYLPTVPGSFLLSYGVNLFHYDPIPYEISKAKSYQVENALKKSRGVQEQLFEMTCSNYRRDWDMPHDLRQGYTEDKSEFFTPDFIETVGKRGEWEYTDDMNHYNSYQEISTSLEAGIELTSDLGFLGGSSLSASYKEKVKTLNKTDVRTLEGRDIKGIVRLELPNHVVSRKDVTPQFVECWKALPVEYESNEEKYQKFLNMFGTHYFKRAEIGSFHYMKSETRNEFISKYSEATLKECAKLRVLGKEFDTESKQVTDEQYSEFLKQSSFTSEVYATSGGMTRNNEENWNRVWPTHPWILNGLLKATYQLIDDDNKQENVRLALIVMQMQTFIQAYETPMNEMINFYGVERIKHEAEFDLNYMGWVWEPTEFYPASMGKCQDNFPSDVQEMVCCRPSNSVKGIVKAYEEIKSYSNSPPLRKELIANETLLNVIVSNAKKIQANLWDIKIYCKKSVRISDWN